MESKSSRRILLWAIILAAVTMLVYWLATRGAEAWIVWSPRTAVVLALIAIATGAAIGSGREINAWTTWEAVLTAVLAGVVGVFFWAWGISVWKLLDVVQVAVPGYGQAIQDLFYGAWFLAAILVPYIVRRPGAAVGAEVVGAIVSAMLGSQWGLTVLISGLAQGGLAEAVFALTGYKRWDTRTILLASCAAALGSWIVDYAFWYNTLATPVLLAMLAARLLSAMVFSGLLGPALAEALVRAGVLDNTALGRERLNA